MSCCIESSCAMRRHHHLPRAAKMRFPVLGCPHSLMHEAWTYVLAGEYCRQTPLRRKVGLDNRRVLLSQNGKCTNAAIVEGQWIFLNPHWVGGKLPAALLDRIVHRYRKKNREDSYKTIRLMASKFYDDAFEKSIPYRDVASALS